MLGPAAGSMGCIKLGREALRLQMLLGAGRSSVSIPGPESTGSAGGAVSLLRQALGTPRSGPRIKAQAGRTLAGGGSVLWATASRFLTWGVGRGGTVRASRNYLITELIAHAARSAAALGGAPGPSGAYSVLCCRGAGRAHTCLSPRAQPLLELGGLAFVNLYLWIREGRRWWGE